MAVTNLSRSFTYKTAAKTSWNRHETKLRHCYPVHIQEAQLSPRDRACQLKFCQLPRNSAETTCTISPEQIEVVEVGGLHWADV